MKTKAALIALSLICGAIASQLKAAEHPEHPAPTSVGSGGEHPKKTSEHPKKTSDDKAFRNDYEKIVKDYVAQESQKTAGAFTIRDDVLNKDWKLSLVKVHKSKICMLQEGKVCFACADFKEVNGKNKLDLDFYADRSADGKMTITKVLIHKLNGKRRFTYDKNNNMVPDGSS